jgi:hypothetical protein
MGQVKGKPEGLHFRRQHPVGPYITDFYCAAARLVIEIDGQVHDDNAAAVHDARRTAYLEKEGLVVYRVTGPTSCMIRTKWRLKLFGKQNRFGGDPSTASRSGTGRPALPISRWGGAFVHVTPAYA